MKNARIFTDIGQAALVLGSALYVVELLPNSAVNLVLPISIIYAASLILLLIGWCGSKEERAARKAEKKAEKQAARAARSKAA